jgi:hypothetical protein
LYNDATIEGVGNMKTFFICANSAVDNHVGEEYDSILEVEDQPTTETMQEWHNRIRGRIRKLWHEDDGDDKYVEIYLDAASPYNALLIDLQIVMEKEEGIDIELAYTDTTVPTTLDSETLEILEKLELKGEQ